MAEINGVLIITITGTEYFPSTAGLPPLTKAYTYPPTCLSQWSQNYPDDSAEYSLLFSTWTYDNYYASCQPGGYSSEYQRYSPGICPSGRTIAIITESQTVPVASDGSGRVWLGACCPIGYAYNWFSDVDNYWCTSSMASSSVVAHRAVISTYTTTISGAATVTTTRDYLDTSNTTIVRYASLNVDPIEVLWKASDLPLFESSYASALASRLKISVPSPTATTLPTFSIAAAPGSSPGMPEPTSPPSSSSSNLSTGAKAGIGVGAALGGLIIAAAVLFLLLRRRKRSAKQINSDPSYNGMAVEAPELVQYYNPLRQSDAMSETTYADNNPKAPGSPSPISPRQGA